MRFALIGGTGHINYYAQALQDLPELQVIAVAAARPDESLQRLRAAPGVAAGTPGYADWQEMLRRERPDVVQICADSNLIPSLAEACLGQGIAVMAEKPLARDLASLEHLYRVARETRVPLAPLHGYRRMDCFALVQRLIAEDRIGEPLASHSQISYKWGKNRGDAFRHRTTFPGIVPFIGIHAIDWMLWMLGDVFTAVTGWEAPTAHPDFPACASQAGLLLQMKNGGIATVLLDFLRPEPAPTHGDERVRIAGTRGVVEALAVTNTVSLVDIEGVHESPVPPFENWYTRFLRSVPVGDAGFITLGQAFRATEIALQAQQAVDDGQVRSLQGSMYSF